MPPPSGQNSKELKLVVVGDGAVGKTCLLVTYSSNRFPEEYEPTVYETYQHQCAVDGTSIKLNLWDTAGQETYDRIRPLSYPNTDVFLICFDVTAPVSFENVKDRWIPEITKQCPGASILLVGTKSDLRYDTKITKQLKDRNQAPVKNSAATKLAKRFKLYKYMECSARTQQNVTEVFEEAVRSVIKPTDSGKLCGLLG